MVRTRLQRSNRNQEHENEHRVEQQGRSNARCRTTFNGVVNAPDPEVLHQLNTVKRQDAANTADDNDTRVEVGDDRRFHPSRSMTSLAFFEALSSATSRRTTSTGRKKRLRNVPSRAWQLYYKGEEGGGAGKCPKISKPTTRAV